MKSSGRRFLWIAAHLLLAAAASGQMRPPEPNPPYAPEPKNPRFRTAARPIPGRVAAPTTEWTLHKTADGAHPNGDEQQMMWLMNRARGHADIEGIWLAHVRQSNVQFAMAYFSVLYQVLMDEFAARTNAPPGAFDSRLYVAASNHSAYLISIDGQNHSNQFTRVTDAGFHYTSARGSVYSYAEDALYGHAGFNVDWGGDDGTGMQTGRGHREGLMGSYSCTGIACVPETNGATTVGPMVITIDYCNASTSYTNHFNRFIVGTVWNDLNTNSLYDAGEGIGSVTVMPDTGTYYAVTGDAGGYAIPVDSGTYQLTFSGGSLPSNIVKSVTAGATNVLLDCPLHGDPPEAQWSVAIDASYGLTGTLNGQQKGYPYRLSACTNLEEGLWTWAGVLPSGHGTSLTYSVSMVDTNAEKRFLALQGWPY